MNPATLNDLAKAACDRQKWNVELIPALADEYRTLLRWFRAEVNRRAEDKMLLTGKLEGSHFAAMTELLAEVNAS